MSSIPGRLLFIRPDTYGDLVLFEPVLRLVRTAFPEMKIGVLIRESYADIAPLLGGDHYQWITTTCNPYKNGPANDPPAVEALGESVRSFAPDCVVAACFERTWLEAAVGYFAPEARQIMLGDRGFDPFVRSVLASLFPIEWDTLYPERISVAESSYEWEKNLRLVDALKSQLGRPRKSKSLKETRSLSQIAKNLDLPLSSLATDGIRRAEPPGPAPTWWPKVSVPEGVRQTARELFAKWGVDPSGLAVCCPAGTANVQIKSWPAAHYGAVVARLEQEHGVRAILLGHEREGETLKAVAENARAAGAKPFMWLGRDGEIAVLAALIEQARLYLGNDTGALHLAGALGRSALSIFGGGHWPRFKPLARRSAVVVQPLPCFGCGWNCLFEYAPCVREIPIASVAAALDWLLESEDSDEREFAVRDAISEQGMALISGTVAALGVPGHGLANDGEMISPARAVELLAKLEFSEKDRTERLQTIESQGREISRLQSEVDRWLQEAGELWPRLNQASNARDQLDAELKNLKAQFATSEADRTERLRVITDQGAEIARLQKETDHWLQEAEGLWSRVNAMENAQQLLALEMEDLRRNFDGSEADRAARLAVIEKQGSEISRLHGEVDRWLKEADRLQHALAAAEQAQGALAAELEDMRRHFAASEADRAARLEVIESQGERLAAAENTGARLVAELEDLRKQFAASEADRVARLVVIERQSAEISRLQAELERKRETLAVINKHWAARFLRALHLWPTPPE